MEPEVQLKLGAIFRHAANGVTWQVVGFADRWRPFRPRAFSPRHRGEPLCFVREGFQPKWATLASLGTRIRLRMSSRPFDPAQRIFGLKTTEFSERVRVPGRVRQNLPNFCRRHKLVPFESGLEGLPNKTVNIRGEGYDSRNFRMPGNQRC